MSEAKQPDAIAGVVESVLYRNESSGYAVMNITTEEGGQATAVGCVPYAAPGEYLEAEGQWTRHPVHGVQFKIERFLRQAPSSEDGIMRYLSSGVIRGVGPSTARRIVTRFGADTLHVIARDPHKLVDIRGISGARAKQIGQAFARQGAVRILMEFLTNHGLPPYLALRLYKRFGPDAVLVVEENPYILTGEYFGADFGTVDAIALESGMEEDSPKRLEAVLLFELWYNLDQGHAYIPRDKLLDAAVQMVAIDRESLEQALDALVDKKEIVCEDTDHKSACYLKRLHMAETRVAQAISEMTCRRLLPPRGITKLVDEIEQMVELTYDEKQRRAMLMAARSRVMLLTGGPGTGKTTTVKALLALFDRIGLKTALAAPTGRAAKRMTELCGAEATTIHRLLEMGYDRESGELVFTRNKANPLKVDAVVVDETSMVDIILMDALLDAMPNDSRLVLVGDPDQLPPVGPGHVLADLIKSQCVDTVCLTEIFRQAQQSAIVIGAHAVNHGQMPTLNRKEGDFFFMRRTSAQDTIETVVALCGKKLPDYLGIDPMQIQVLTPTRRTLTGTSSLNMALQMAINPPSPGKTERRIGDMVLREGDRVMQTKNNYDLPWRSVDESQAGLGVFNGDIGQIVSINPRNESITVRFDDRLVDYPFEMQPQLELSYAMTVHKSQGSEYEAVIFIAMQGPKMLMNRQVLYTAMTRARSLLVVVGVEEALSTMVENHRRYGRYSGLSWRLVALSEDRARRTRARLREKLHTRGE